MRYIYAGENIVLALDGQNKITNRYLHGPSVDQVLADEQFNPALPVGGGGSAGDVLWLLPDHQGSTSDIVDSALSVVNHITYDPWGQITSETNTAINEIYGYASRETDEESHLNFNRARYLDPATGRWISEDPIGFAAGDPNLSRYVGNSPTNFTDPSGLQDRPLDQGNLDGLDKLNGRRMRGSATQRSGSKVLAGDILEGTGKGVELIPGVGTLKQGADYLKGEDVVSGRKLSPEEANSQRNNAVVGAAAAPVGGFLAGAARFFRGLVGGKKAATVVKTATKAADTAPAHVDKALDATKATGKADEVTTTLRKSKTAVDGTARKHVLDGDKTGGGHRAGTGKPGKSEFPKEWSDDKICDLIADVANDPTSARTPSKLNPKRTVVKGTRDGIEIEVIIEDPAKGGRIVTGYPTNVPKNPKK